MLSLWYIILGWKEYNKPFRKNEQPEKSVDPVKKPDLIPQKKDGPSAPTKPADIKKPEPPKPVVNDPKKPGAFDSLFSNNKTPEPPKTPEVSAPKTPEVPKPAPKLPEPPKLSPEVPKMPDVNKFTPKTPEPPKVPDSSKFAPKTPEPPKTQDIPKFTPQTPESPKVPDPPKIAPRTPGTPKEPDFPRFAPEKPKTPDTPKTSDLPKFQPKTPETPNFMMPSKGPDSVLPNFPSPKSNPAYVPPSTPSDFSMPPFVPGTPSTPKPLTKDDELFNVGRPIGNSSPKPNKPFENLRDLSYAKGEFPSDSDIKTELDAFKNKVQENLSKVPKYMEESVISNPDSLESDEEDDE